MDGATLLQAEYVTSPKRARTFDVPILIVSYSRPQDVAVCLRALSRSAMEPKFEVFVAENAGSAAFDALLAELLTDSGPCVAASPDDVNLMSPVAVRQRQ